MNLQQKRQVFREQIRRKQIQQLFSKRRQQFLSEKNSFRAPSSQTKEQIYQTIYQFFERLQINSKNSEYIKISTDIDLFIQQYDKRQPEMNYCLNQFFNQSGKQIIEMAKKKVPFEVLGDIQEEEKIIEPNNESEQEFDHEITIIYKLVNLGSKLKLNKFSLESCILIIRVIEKIFKEKYHLPVEDFPSTHKKSAQILFYTLEILKNMLKNPKSKEGIKEELQKIGFEEQISILIDLSKQFPDYMHEQFLNLLMYYVETTKQQKQPKQQDKIYKQCHVISTQHPHRQKQLLYCLYFIINEKQQFYGQALTIIDEIFNADCYLISEVKVKYLRTIADFILGSNRNFIVSSLFVINTVVFYSGVSVDELIAEGALLDILQQRLVQQMNSNLPNRQLIITKCTFILQDLLLTKTMKVKKIIHRHSIWQLLYNSIADGHPLLPTIVVFQYYFESVGRTETLKIIPNFLNALASIDLNSPRECIKEIREIIVCLFEKARQFWEDEDFEIIKNNIESNNLLFIIEKESQM